VQNPGNNIPNLIGCRFRVQGLRVRTNRYSIHYRARSGIFDIPLWIERFYKDHEASIILIKAV
jgi:hypothetical protein